MPARFYVDTSAYLAVLLGERGHETIVKQLRRAQLLSSVLLILESQRNLIRLSREDLLSPGDLRLCLDRVSEDIELFELRDLTLDLCQELSMPVVSTPRSLDLAHLRTASRFHEQEPLTGFVSLDEAQRLAAQELGLPV